MNKFISTFIAITCMLFIASCAHSNTIVTKTKDNDSIKKASEIQPIDELKENIINENGNTIKDRFEVPKSFKRTQVDEKSFGHYLRNLQLKPHGSMVYYYNGKVKTKENVYIGVIDIDVGDRDLQQCADAVMRLRAEYLYKNKRYDEIHFNFVNGFNCEYLKWRNGYRVSVNGNKTNWVKKASYSDDYEVFRKYLDMLFAYAGTLSLEKELISVDIENINIGDVFIQGGSPGHAVIIVDMAENLETGEKLFMLAQSYMPAQEIQILCNNNDMSISPWYSVEFTEQLKTPEWIFKKDSLKRFE